MVKRNFIKVLLACLLGSSVGWADDYIVLDGCRGPRNRYMALEVESLRFQGHRVLYLPWWRWRFAARRVQGPVSVIGYSLGGSRAAWLSHRIDAWRLELVDPVQLVGAIRLPETPQATIYRATIPSSIRSSLVIGHHQEILVPADHGAMPRTFQWFRPWD